MPGMMLPSNQESNDATQEGLDTVDADGRGSATGEYQDTPAGSTLQENHDSSAIINN